MAALHLSKVAMVNMVHVYIIVSSQNTKNFVASDVFPLNEKRNLHSVSSVWRGVRTKGTVSGHPVGPLPDRFIVYHECDHES